MGMKKKRIIPDVILLKIDHYANMATPTVVNEDKSNNNIFRLYSQIIIKGNYN
jgi:hypothetical protein